MIVDALYREHVPAFDRWRCGRQVSLALVYLYATEGVRKLPRYQRAAIGYHLGQHHGLAVTDSTLLSWLIDRLPDAVDVERRTLLRRRRDRKRATARKTLRAKTQKTK